MNGLAILAILALVALTVWARWAVEQADEPVPFDWAQDLPPGELGDEREAA